MDYRRLLLATCVLGSLHATPESPLDQETRFKIKIKKEKLAGVLFGLAHACANGSAMAKAQSKDERQQAALNLVGDVFTIAGIIASKPQAAPQVQPQQTTPQAAQPIIIVQMPANTVEQKQQELQAMTTRLAGLFEHTRQLDGGQNMPQFPALMPFQQMPSATLPAAFAQYFTQPNNGSPVIIQQLFAFCQQTIQQQVVQTFTTSTHDLEEWHSSTGEEWSHSSSTSNTTTTTSSNTSHILQLYAGELLTQQPNAPQPNETRSVTPLSAELTSRIDSELNSFFAELTQETIRYLE